VRSSAEVGERFFECEGVGRLHEHESHRGSEQDDVRGGIAAELLSLKISRRGQRGL
jgi:hypothetical protein